MSQLQETESEEISQSDALAFRQRIQRDPAFFATEVLGLKYPLWDGQLKILEQIATRDRVVVGSGHALGKDFIASVIALWFLYSHYPSKVILTAPSQRQVKDIMWTELTMRFKNSKYPLDGDLMSLKLKVEDEWFCEGFTTKEVNNSIGKFQGYHSPNILVILSEAQAIDESIFEQVDGVLTSENSKLLMIGNPLRSTGEFANSIRNTTRNSVINLSCLDSPNVIAGAEIIPGLVSKRWVEDKRIAYGEGSPLWQSKVLGLIPDVNIDAIVSDALWSKCLTKNLTFWSDKRGSIGVDPGRYGDDDMVISVFESGELKEEIVIPKCSAPEGCSKVVIAQKKHFPQGGCVLVFDCDGLGGPYLDITKQMIPDELNCRFIEIHGASTDKEVVSPEYQNVRAEMAFYAKEMMEKGAISFGYDASELARQEATGEQYYVNIRGKNQVEDKDDIKERIGRSPNRWDARKLAIWGFKYAQPIKPKDRWKSDPERSMAPDITAMTA